MSEHHLVEDEEIMEKVNEDVKQYISDMDNQRRSNLFDFVDTIQRGNSVNICDDNLLEPQTLETEVEINNREEDEIEYLIPKISQLNQNLSTFLLENHERLLGQDIKICAYHVNKYNKTRPFLQFFLFKNNMFNGDNFKMVQFKYESSLEVISKSLMIMEVLSKSYYCKSDYVYKGFEYDGKSVYLYFDCSSFKLSTLGLSRNNDLWLVLMDEIQNHGSICGFKVDDSVRNYFISNSDMLCVLNEKGRVYESPIVAYTGCNRRMFDFQSFFGAGCGGETAMLGNYQYFSDYANAVRKAGWNEDASIGGIVRYAIFPGNMKVKMNNEDDPVDGSIETFELMKEMDTNSKEYKTNMLQMRLNDRGGSWTINYDSVYIGKVELDDGSYFEDYPLWAVKDYEQQIVLSSHLLDKKTIIDEWSRDKINEYKIY